MDQASSRARWVISVFVLLVTLLSACAPATTPSPTATATTSPIPPTATSSVRMLPTWTPSPTPPLIPSPTSRPTATSQATDVITLPPSSGVPSPGLLVDRPVYATLPKPTKLVTLQYDPTIWSLNTAYPTALMSYSLSHRGIYDCKLEPTLAQSAEGYQVESYSRALGATSYQISRFSQAGALLSADYCTGEGEDRTCYKLAPGDDHEACTQASEAVLATYQLIPNQFLDPIYEAPNHWLCQDETAQDGRCTVSYSVPLNALTYTANNEGWAAGDDGLIFHLANQAWSAVDSPSIQPIYDMSFSSPTDGWAVGKGAQVLHWDGDAWSEILPYHGPGEGPGGSTQVLFGVDARTADDAWMVGIIKALDGKNYPHALHWNGTDLVEENAFPDCGCGLNAVLALDEQDVLAVGSSPLGAIALRWDGTEWSSEVIKGADILYALRRTADGTVWAAGGETARDRSDTRGALFYFANPLASAPLASGSWQRVALPPLTGWIYQLAILPTGQVALGGDFTALWTGSEWQPILAGLAGYGWIVDIEVDAQGITWALTRSGNLFRLEVGK